MRLNLRAKLVELFSSHNPEKLDELIAPQYVVIGDSEYFADTDWRKDQGSHPSKYTGNCLAFSKLFGQISSRISE